MISTLSSAKRKAQPGMSATGFCLRAGLFVSLPLLLAACGGGGGGGGGTPSTGGTVNTPPEAPNVAGQVVEDTPKSVTLPATDADGDPLTYTVVTLPSHGSVTVSGDTATYTPAANYTGADSFTYKVNDGSSDSNVATVSITVTPVNDNPTANAGADQEVNEAASVSLSGSGSDLDGDSLTYSWVQTGGGVIASLTGADTAAPTFTAPAVDADTTLTFTLTVSDGNGGTAMDTVNVLVKNVPVQNTAPTANAGADQEVNEAASVSLSGSGSDPDGDSLTYSWGQTGGGVIASLTGADTAAPTFTAPAVDADTTLTFTLTVSDGKGGTAMDSVNVVVKDAVVVQPSPTGKLNDTGITKCGDYAYAFDAGQDKEIEVAGHTHSSNEECSLLVDAEGDSIPPDTRAAGIGQDGHVGRDTDASTNGDDDGYSGFSFTKIGADGKALADQSVAYATTPWSCVKDNVTGLIWEVRTGIYPVWAEVNVLVNEANTNGLCGATSGWRMPTPQELQSLADLSRTPAIDTRYFPNVTVDSAPYWSGMPDASDSGKAWYVYFKAGWSATASKTSGYHVRLVRSE